VKRVLSVFSLVMINVIAVDSLRGLPISAEYGFSLVFFYLIGAIIFFIPTALVAAELATGWPSTGGIYVWVKEAFGVQCGFFTIWMQWIYNVVWYPTILAFIAGTIAYLIDPTLVHSLTYMLTSVLILFWSATLVNLMGMKVSSMVSTIGAIVGTIVPMIFIIVLGIIWVALGNPVQIEFTQKALLPDLSELGNLPFFSAILFGLIGLEMSAVHAEEVKNPAKDYPKALLISALIILITIILSSLAIAIVIPHDQIDLVEGLINAFGIFFTTFNIPWMIPVIGVLIIIGGLGGVSTWVIGPTKGLLAATRDGITPPVFHKVNKKGSPVTILLLQGIVFTLLCSVFLIMPSVNTSYWVLSALAAQLALMVYIVMFAAAIRLRYKKPHIERAYKIPFGNVGIWIVCGVGILACIGTILIGFIPPSNVDAGNILTYESILIFGIIFFSLPPFIIYKFRKPGWSNHVKIEK